MTVQQARRWLVDATLVLMAATLAFYLVAPSLLQYPLDWNESLELLRMSAPLLVGYLALATRFALSKEPSPPSPDGSGKLSASPLAIRDPRLFGRVVQMPVLIYALAILLLLASYGYSNRVGHPPGENPMPFDTLANYLTLANSLLTATTSVLAATLYEKS